MPITSKVGAGTPGANTVGSSQIIDLSIVNADVSASANIAWTKIDKTGATASDVGALSGTFVIDKTSDVTLVGAVNGSNTTFTLSATPVANSLDLKLNGITLDKTDHYTLVGTTITLADAPQSGDRLSAYYAS